MTPQACIVVGASLLPSRMDVRAVPPPVQVNGWLFTSHRVYHHHYLPKRVHLTPTDQPKPKSPLSTTVNPTSGTTTHNENTTSIATNTKDSPQTCAIDHATVVSGPRMPRRAAKHYAAAATVTTNVESYITDMTSGRKGGADEGHEERLPDAHADSMPSSSTTFDLRE